MPVYRYRGRGSSGTIAADSPRAARDLLRAAGVAVESMREIAAPRAGFSLSGWANQRAYPAASRNLVRELSTLLAVGVPIGEALTTILEQYPRGGFRVVVLHLQQQVLAGVELSRAMADYPAVFSPVARAMVAVGEQSGTLDQVLEQLSSFQDRSAQLQDRVVTALLYPAIVLVASVGVTIFLMTMVIPTLLESLIEADRPLPWPTRWLKWLSDGLCESGGWLALLVVVVGGGGVWFWRTEVGRSWIDRISLQVPILGTLIVRQAVARVSLVMSVLLRSGIPFVSALEIGKQAIQHRSLRGGLDAVQTAVGEGIDLGPALAATKVFPPVVVQVFTVGQQSGRLEDLLERLATDYDRQAAQLAGRLATLVEPLLIAVLSVVVGFIVFATVLPILEAGNVL